MKWHLTYNSDIAACIVETWLDASVSDNEINFAGFSVYRCDRNRHGGGVLLFVKNYLGVKVLLTQLPDVTTHKLEFLVLSLLSFHLQNWLIHFFPTSQLLSKYF